LFPIQISHCHFYYYDRPQYFCGSLNNQIFTLLYNQFLYFSKKYFCINNHHLWSPIVHNPYIFDNLPLLLHSRSKYLLYNLDFRLSNFVSVFMFGCNYLYLKIYSFFLMVNFVINILKNNLYFLFLFIFQTEIQIIYIFVFMYIFQYYSKLIFLNFLLTWMNPLVRLNFYQYQTWYSIVRVKYFIL
jgi:hypothetical protein